MQACCFLGLFFLPLWRALEKCNLINKAMVGGIWDHVLLLQSTSRLLSSAIRLRKLFFLWHCMQMMIVCGFLPSVAHKHLITNSWCSATVSYIFTCNVCASLLFFIVTLAIAVDPRSIMTGTSSLVKRTFPGLISLESSIFVNIHNLAFAESFWSSSNAFASGAGALRFKSRVRQIRHSIVNDLPLLKHFFKRSCVARVQWRRAGPRKLVSHFGVTQRVYWKIDLSFHKLM